MTGLQEIAAVASGVAGAAQVITPLLTLGLAWGAGRVYQRLVALEQKVDSLSAAVGHRRQEDDSA